jgi:CelD/BcsL family acetyltransferase involved in cellulose biosynthesis
MRAERAGDLGTAVGQAPAGGAGLLVSPGTGLAMLNADDRRWLELVRRHPDASAFHHPGWSRVVSSAYGFRCVVLALEDGGGRVVAGIPVAEVRNPWSRRRLVALPFTDHCPPLVEPGQDPAVFAERLAVWPGGRDGTSLEVRADLPLGAGRRTVGSLHVLELDPEPDSLFRRLHRNRIQKRVRRAHELGVEVSIGRSRADVAAFYDLHCQTRRRQGVPVQPRRFIESIWKEMIDPGLGFVVLARSGGRPVATALFLAWNRRLIYKYGASDRAHWKLGANFLVHWTAMEWGCVNGFLLYDFGRTDLGHDSLREFKSAWGATEVPLVYSHLGAESREVGRGRGAAALAHVIQRSPTLVCRALGELLYRYAA